MNELKNIVLKSSLVEQTQDKTAEPKNEDGFNWYNNNKTKKKRKPIVDENLY